MLSSCEKRCTLIMLAYLLWPQGLMGQTTTTWNDGGVGNGWDVAANWDLGVPDDMTNAHHLTSASDARVNVTNAECKSFKGDPDAPNDRFLIIGGGKYLDVKDGGMLSNDAGTKFPVKFEDGGGVLTPSRITVEGDVTDMAFGPALHHTAEWSSIILENGGNMSDCLVDLGENSVLDVAGNITDTEVDFRSAPGASITVGGNVHVGAGDWNIDNDSTVQISGNVTGSAENDITIGTSAGTSGTPVTVTVGSMGATTPISNKWTLGGYTDLIVNNDFTASTNGIDFIMNNHATMTVNGETTGAEWFMNDSSTFVAEGPVTEGVWRMTDSSTVTIKNGFEGRNTDSFWKLEGDSELEATGAYEVDGADWILESRSGGPSRIEILTSGSEFNPELLTIENGEVEVANLGFDTAGSPTHLVWDMEFRGDAEVLIHHEGWHEENNASSANNAGSKLTYDGTNNVYKLVEGARGINISGPIIQADGSATLKIEIDSHETQHSGYLDIESAVVLDVSGTTRFLDMDTEGISLWMTEGQCEPDGHLEPFSPDYANHWVGDPVVFLDSKCVRRWGELKIINDTGSSTQCTQLANRRINHPIDVEDALYVNDLTVESGAVLKSGNHIRGVLYNIYYTGDLDCAGSTNCTASPAEIVGTDGTTGYQPIHAKLSYYGDFDGDETPLHECDPDDIMAFNCVAFKDQADESTTYNPLMDWNCDAKIDCADYCQFVANFDTSCEGQTLASTDDNEVACSCE